MKKESSIGRTKEQKGLEVHRKIKMADISLIIIILNMNGLNNSIKMQRFVSLDSENMIQPYAVYGDTHQIKRYHRFEAKVTKRHTSQNQPQEHYTGIRKVDMKTKIPLEIKRDIL